MDEQLNKLAVLEQADKLLAEITTVFDAKHLMARAEAARAYAKEVGMGQQIQNRAAEVKLRAAREGGRVLLDMKNRGELHFHNGVNAETALTTGVVTLNDLGISNHNSEQWQYFYRLPIHVFEEGISQFWSDERELTTYGLYQWGKSYGKPPKEEKAPLTNATAYEQIKKAVEIIRDSIRFIKSSANNGGGKEAKYYLRWVIQTMTDIAVGLVKEGFDYDPGD